MKILGIDTNRDFIAWTIVDIIPDNESIIEWGQEYDGKLYYHNVMELVKRQNDIISIEDFKYYRNVGINQDSIEAIKRIGHIQAACYDQHKELWQFHRPDILKSLFGSSRIKKPISKRLLKVRVNDECKGIPQHNLDAAMVAIYAYYFILTHQEGFFDGKK